MLCFEVSKNRTTLDRPFCINKCVGKFFWYAYWRILPGIFLEVFCLGTSSHKKEDKKTGVKLSEKSGGPKIRIRKQSVLPAAKPTPKGFVSPNLLCTIGLEPPDPQKYRWQLQDEHQPHHTDTGGKKKQNVVTIGLDSGWSRRRCWTLKRASVGQGHQKHRPNRPKLPKNVWELCVFSLFGQFRHFSTFVRHFVDIIFSGLSNDLPVATVEHWRQTPPMEVPGGLACRGSSRLVLNSCLSSFCASFFLSFFPLPPSPSFLNPPPSSDLKTPPFPRGNAIFRGWGAARVLEGVTPQKKEGISLKNGAQKLVSCRTTVLLPSNMAIPRQNRTSACCGDRHCFAMFLVVWWSSPHFQIETTKHQNK